MTFILVVCVLILFFRVWRIEDQILKEKYKLKETRRRLMELELKDIDVWEEEQ